MKAQDVQDYLRSLAGEWQYPADTVDTFKAGDPSAEVRGIAVGWMSYTWALQRALELGCNVFITHEPTYYNHWDNDQAIFRLPGVERKAPVHRGKRSCHHPLPRSLGSDTGHWHPGLMGKTVGLGTPG